MSPAPPLKHPDQLPRVGRRSPGASDHAYIAALRAAGPVAVDRYGFFWTFSLAGLEACVDPRVTCQVETEKAEALGHRDGPVHEYFANSLLFSNGAAHQRRRGPLAKAFAHRAVDGARPAIRAAAEALIRPCLGAGEVDFLAAIAGPLPARIVAGILGAPPGDIPRFSALVGRSMRALSLRPGEAAGAADLAALNAYVDGLLAARRAAPQDDFLTDFTRRADEAGLAAVEARVQIVSVILAGSDTTRMALAATFAALLQRPDQWAALVAAPEALKAAAAAEGLRHDPPVGALPRVATADFALEGAAIPAGAVLSPSVIGALRDPAIYDAPARFDIHRTDHPRLHPVFGAGAHRCLGEALARAELEEALAALARLAPGAALAGPPPTLKGVSGARAIDAMRVRLG